MEIGLWSFSSFCLDHEVRFIHEPLSYYFLTDQYITNTVTRRQSPNTPKASCVRANPKLGDSVSKVETEGSLPPVEDKEGSNCSPSNHSHLIPESEAQVHPYPLTVDWKVKGNVNGLYCGRLERGSACGIWTRLLTLGNRSELKIVLIYTVKYVAPSLELEWPSSKRLEGG